MVMAREYQTHDADEADYDGDEFAFEDGDESLPWLESDEDDGPAPFDTTRLIGIALVMIALLAALVGGIWWLSNSGATGGPEPDGSTIAAPEGPYKTAPEDEGGKTFPGTGDTSFAVGEGQTREGRLADRTEDSSAAAPGIDTLTTPDREAPAAEPRSSPLPKGTAVQVGAYSNRNDAEAGWRTLTRQTEVLSGVDYRIVQGQADIGTVYRLQAVGGDAANARRICRELGAAGLPCTVK